MKVVYCWTGMKLMPVLSPVKNSVGFRSCNFLFALILYNLRTVNSFCRNFSCVPFAGPAGTNFMVKFV